MSDHDRVASLEARVASLEQAMADLLGRSGAAEPERRLAALEDGLRELTALVIEAAEQLENAPGGGQTIGASLLERLRRTYGSRLDEP